MTATDDAPDLTTLPATDSAIREAIVWQTDAGTKPLAASLAQIRSTQ